MSQVIEWVVSTFENLRDLLLSPQFVYSPVYLAASVLIAFLVWRHRGGRKGFTSYLFPREIYRNPSTIVDLKILIFNFVFLATGALSVFVIAPLVTYKVLQGLNSLVGEGTPPDTTLFRGVLVAATLFVTQDFCRFLNHYLHHRNKVLWPFHAVHHTAEVLSPLTFMRAHPLYYAFQRLLISTLVGFVQGVVLFAIVRDIEMWVIYSGTLAFQTYILLGSHLRHSHIRLSYGRFLEHILISPAQHQVHHSSDPRHFDKNFGEIFAVWDWMFGTLYIADGDEKLVFGIADESGKKIAQPHTNLREALLQPFAESGRALREMSPWRDSSKAPPPEKITDDV